MKISNMYGAAYDWAIVQVADWLNEKFGSNYSYKDWRVLEPFAIVNQFEFDENGDIINIPETISASRRITASKLLKIRRRSGKIDTYEYKREDGQGSVYEPTDADNWWSSYIVTPEGQLLSWTTQGKYYPSNNEFWIEDDAVEGCGAIEASDDYEATAAKNAELAEKIAPILDRHGYNGSYFIDVVNEEYYYDDLSNIDDLHAVVCGFVITKLIEDNDGYGGSEEEEKASRIADEILSEANLVSACDNITASTYIDNGAFGAIGEVYTKEELKTMFNNLCAEGDPVCNTYDSFESWFEDTLESGLIQDSDLDASTVHRLAPNNYDAITSALEAAGCWYQYDEDFDRILVLPDGLAALDAAGVEYTEV